MDGPVRITEHFTRHEDEVGLALGDDGVGLRRLGDHADGGGRNGCFFADAGGEINLVAGSHGNFYVRHESARGTIDQVDRVIAEDAAELDRVVDGPATFDPVARGDADEEGQVGGPDAAHFIDDPYKQADAVLEAAAIGVGA